MEPWMATANSRAESILVGLRQAAYLLERALEGLPREAIWWEPAQGIPGIGPRVRHLVRAGRRLLAYARNEALDREALARQAQEDFSETWESAEPLLEEVRRFAEEVRAFVEGLREGEWAEICAVGRKRVPVSRALILHHLVEHTAHHVGQVLLLRRLWEATRSR